MAIDKTIRELLDKAELSAETAADLETYLGEFKAGELHPDDEAYVLALHGRLLGGGGTPKPRPAAKPRKAEPVAAAADGDEDGTDWQARAEAAEAELAALRAGPAGGSLAEVRARLSEALHPDKGEYGEAEAAARAAALAEVWAVLDEIEAGTAGSSQS